MYEANALLLASSWPPPCIISAPQKRSNPVCLTHCPSFSLPRCFRQEQGCGVQHQSLWGSRRGQQLGSETHLVSGTGSSHCPAGRERLERVLAAAVWRWPWALLGCWVPSLVPDCRTPEPTQGSGVTPVNTQEAAALSLELQNALPQDEREAGVGGARAALGQGADGCSRGEGQTGCSARRGRRDTPGPARWALWTGKGRVTRVPELGPGLCRALGGAGARRTQCWELALASGQS